MRRIIKSLFFLLICGVMLVVYAFVIEPAIIIEHEFDLYAAGASEPESQVVKVVQFSDVHIREYGKLQHLEKLVKKVNDLEPDIIVFTGDLYDNYASYGPRTTVIECLGQLKAKYGKYGIWGNRDYGGGASRKYADIMVGADFTLLKNSGETVMLESGKTIYIGGADDALLGRPDPKKTLAGRPEDCDYQILLMHEPDQAGSYVEAGVDLILAGHSHGGQVRIPFTEMITTKMAKKYTGGFYDLDGKTPTRLYVNTGIGTTRIPARFLVPPELSVFQIHL